MKEFVKEKARKCIYKYLSAIKERKIWNEWENLYKDRKTVKINLNNLMEIKKVKCKNVECDNSVSVESRYAICKKCYDRMRSEKKRLNKKLKQVQTQCQIF